MVVAAGFAAIMSVEYVFLGSGTIARIGVTLPTILLMYVGAGLLAGIVLGVGRPLGKTHIGAIILGIFVATCVYGSACVAIYGLPNHWHGAEWFSSIAPGVVIGAFAGDKFFNDYA
jgi:hypothetical protein